jgi:hypothetical protein
MENSRDNFQPDQIGYDNTKLFYTYKGHHLEENDHTVVSVIRNHMVWHSFLKMNSKIESGNNIITVTGKHVNSRNDEGTISDKPRFVIKIWKSPDYDMHVHLLSQIMYCYHFVDNVNDKYNEFLTTPGDKIVEKLIMVVLTVGKVKSVITTDDGQENNWGVIYDDMKGEFRRW